MDLTFVDSKSLKNLEEYAVFLVTGLLSLKTLESFQVRVIEIGILKEDQACRTNTIIWDLRRLMKLYQDQLDSVLELLPDDFTAGSIVTALKAKELSKAKQMAKKGKVKSE